MKESVSVYCLWNLVKALGFVSALTWSSAKQQVEEVIWGREKRCRGLVMSQAVEFSFWSRLLRLPKDGESQLVPILHKPFPKHIFISASPGLGSIWAWHREQRRRAICLQDRSAAAKSLQSCPTLCDRIDSSPPGSPIPGILQARTLEWVAISFSNAWKWKWKSLSHIRLLATPWTAAHQAPPSMGFSRQEYWSGVPLGLNKTRPSPSDSGKACGGYTFPPLCSAQGSHSPLPCQMRPSCVFIPKFYHQGPLPFLLSPPIPAIFWKSLLTRLHLLTVQPFSHILAIKCYIIINGDFWFAWDNKISAELI